MATSNTRLSITTSLSATGRRGILHLNSVLSALRGISQLITLEEDRGKLLQKSCDLLVKTRGYDNAW